MEISFDVIPEDVQTALRRIGYVPGTQMEASTLQESSNVAISDYPSAQPVSSKLAQSQKAPDAARDEPLNLGLPSSQQIDSREAMRADLVDAPPQEAPPEVIVPVIVQQSSVDVLVDITDVLFSGVTGLELNSKERRLHGDAYKGAMEDAGIARIPGFYLAVAAWTTSILSRLEKLRSLIPWKKSNLKEESEQSLAQPTQEKQPSSHDFSSLPFSGITAKMS